MLDFEIAAGSIIGRDHILSGKNNQDAFHVVQTNSRIIAVVCDGCGSSNRSEVGAQLGSRLLTNRLNTLLQSSYWDNTEELKKLDSDAIIKQVRWTLERARLDVLAELRTLANAMGTGFTKTIEEYFLFTVVGAVVTPALTFFFNSGDGVLWINGQSIPLDGVIAQNTPCYLAYAMIDVEVKTKSDYGFKIPTYPMELLDLTIKNNAILFTENVDSFLIATDGAEAIEKPSARVEQDSKLVSQLYQFWTEDRFFANSDMMRRQLNLLSKEMIQPDWNTKIINRDTGNLKDDTTLISVRRKSND